VKLKARALAGLGGAAASAALAMALLLILVARGPHQSARAADLRTSDDAAARLLQRPAVAASGVVLCQSGLQTSAAEVRQALQRTSSDAGLVLRAVEFAPLSSELPRGMSGAQMRLVVTGGDKALAQFLRSASQARLPIVLDAVEIKRLGGGSVQAEFSGRLLCRRAA